MGMTVHVSCLDRKLNRLSREYPSPTAEKVEDWLVDVANARGANIVRRDTPPGTSFAPPPKVIFSDEELIVSICMLQRLDRPQSLRLAAQMISRGKITLNLLSRLAAMERTGVVLGEMARQALKVDPKHSIWRKLHEKFSTERELRSPVIHWQRLAWPIMSEKGYNAKSWRLVC